MPENQPSTEITEALTPEQKIAELEQQLAAMTRERDRYKKEATTDPLTGILSRRYLDESLKIELARVTRKETRLAIIMLDIDHFKQINDNSGHPVGDEVLIAFSHAIKGHLRDGDTFGRFGGEEFMVFLPIKDETTKEEIQDIIQRYRDSVSHIRRPENSDSPENSAPLTFSDGVLIIEKGSVLSPEDAIEMTDKNLYTSKEEGRNRSTISTVSPAV